MILSVTGLRRSFGRTIAVDDAQFQLEPGEVVGITGPSGSGKSTLLKLLAGVLEPDFGEIRLLGFDAISARRQAQERMAFVPFSAPLSEDATGEKMLRRVARARGLSGAEARHAVLQAAKATQLDEGFSKPIELLGRGQRRRLALAVALMHEPVLLLLDEIDQGLDHHERQGMRAVLTDLAQDRAIVMASRWLEEIEAVCNRVLVLYRGRIVEDRRLTPEMSLITLYQEAMTLRGGRR